MWQGTERPWLVSGFFSLFFIAFAISGLGFSESARIMPLVISIPGAALSFGQLIKDLKAAWSAADTASDQGNAALPRMLAWLALAIFLAILFGLTVGCGLFIALFLVFSTGYRVRYCIAIALGFMVLQFAVFTLLLDIRLYTGPIMNALGL